MKLYTEAELDKMLKALYESGQLSRCNRLPYYPKPIEVMLIGLDVNQDLPGAAGIIQETNFYLWLSELKQIAEARMPNDYKKGDAWDEGFWKDKYWRQGMTPSSSWADYTKHVN